MHRHKCRFFGKLVKRWNSNQFSSRRSRRSPKLHLRPAIAFGAAAIMGVSLGWAEEDPMTSSPVNISSPVINQPIASEPVPVETIPVSTLPEVVVTGEGEYRREKVSSPKYTEPLRNIPQTITIIPKEVMQDQGATSLRQVLRNVPGISMQAGEGGVPAGDNLSIRGFNARTDFYSDGMRDLGGYFRDPFNLESVEVSKGPSSVTAGRGSTGGSINQVSKWAEMNPIYDGSLGFGTDNYKRGTFDVNVPVNEADGTAVRVNAMWHENDTPRRDAIDNQRWGLAPSVAFGLGTPTRLTLGYYHLAQDNTPDYGIPWVPETNTALAGYRGRPAPVDLNNFYGLKDRDYEKTVSDVLTAKFDHDFNESLSLNDIARSGQTTRDSVITSPRFVSDSTTTVNRQLQSRDQEDDIVANQLNLTAKFKTGFVSHDAVLGSEISRESQLNFLRSGPTATPADLYDPNPYTPYAGPVRRNGTSNEAIAESMAFYLFDTFKVGQKWEIPTGLRWESYGVRFTSSTVGTSTPVKFDRTDRMLSGRAGLVFKPTDTGSIYAGYGTSFNPSAEGLTSGFNAALALLDPEESKSYEVGTKWDLIRRRLAGSLAFFRTEKTNARTPGVNPGDTPTVLQGKQRVDGVEIGASGNLTRNWQLFSGATFMTSEVLESNTPAEVGKEIINTPNSSYSIWTTYQFPTKLEIGGGVQYVSSRYGNATNTRQVGSYTTYDAMASYPINDRATLRLNVNNISNEEYYDSLGGGHVIPGAGRSATLTTDIKFGPKP
jgi:catecholate siderophore receptor